MTERRTEMKGELLELQGLSVCYDDREILRDVDLRFSKGLTVILGQNGSGKTTLFRTISGVKAPQSGNVFLDGEEILCYSVRKRAQCISRVLGTSAPISGITGFDLAEMACYPEKGLFYRLSADEAEEISACAETLGIGHLLCRTLETMSAGERQLTELLGAVCQHAPVMLLDEATANLDFNHAHEFLKTVRSLSKERIVLSTMHDPGLALTYGERIVLLHDGRATALPDLSEAGEREIEEILRPIYPHIGVHRVGKSFTVSYEE